MASTVGGFGPARAGSPQGAREPGGGRQSLVAPAAAGLLSVFGAELDEEVDEPDEESLEDDDAVDVEDPDERLSVR